MGILPNVFPKQFLIHQRIRSNNTATAGAGKRILSVTEQKWIKIGMQ
jgi:hypothetical protein